MKRSLALMVWMASPSAWSANICGVQHVELMEPRDPHGVWQLVVTTESVPRTLKRKDGSTLDLAQQLDADLQRFTHDDRRPAGQQRGFRFPWPPRFELEEGDATHVFLGAHEGCELAAIAVNGRLTLKVTGTSCYSHAGGPPCSASTQFIMPAMPTR